MTTRGRGAHFATTHWSLVLTAGADLSRPQAQQALATLCETYWYPLYVFLRGRGYGAEDAKDLTQAFFARLLEKQVLQHADPARGRFRSFLLTALKNFAANQYDRESAAKRGGGASVLSLEFETAEGRFQIEPPTTETPERVFDRLWALTLLDRAMSRLQQDATSRKDAGRFERLRQFLGGDDPHVSYAEIAAELGMSDGAVKVAVHRLRRRFRDLLRDEIAHTVSTPEQVDDELQHLWASVRREA